MILTGCAAGQNSNSDFDNSKISETFLEQSDNYPRLIKLYKQQLKQKENSETRLKLAQVYIDTNDNESALFTLVPLVTMAKSSSTVFYLQGVAQYNLGKLPQALHSLEIAVRKSSNDPRAINMLGVAQAELGLIQKARLSFNKARELMYDDVAIKNNLALLDMIEGNFKQAAARLMPIYVNSPSKADAKVKANLAIIVSKLGSFETLKSLYSDKYSDAQLFDLFHSLRASEPATRMSQKAIKKPVKDAAYQNVTYLEKVPVANSEATPNQVPSVPLLDNELFTDSSPQVGNLLKEEQLKSKEESKNDSLADSVPFKKQSVVQKIDPHERFFPPKTTETLDLNPPPSVYLSDYSSNPEIGLESNEKPLSKQRHRDEFSELTGIKRQYDKNFTTLFPKPIDRPDRSHLELQKVDGIAVKKNDYSKLITLKRDSVPIRADELEQPIKQVSQAIEVDANPMVSVTSSSRESSEQRKQKPVKKWDFVKLSDYSLDSSGGLNIPVAQFRHHGNLIDVTLEKHSPITTVE